MSLNENLYFGASKEIKQKARDLRKRMTAAEKVLWQRIRNNQLGYKFRRQHPVDIFIADFYCHEKKLVIEVDGGIHQTDYQKDYDTARTNELIRYGIKVLRFKNEEIINFLESVIIDINKELEAREGV